METDARIPLAYRVREASFHIREADESGRTVYGRFVPYGQEATVNDGDGPYRERFAPGAFTRSLEQQAHKVVMFVQHDRRSLPLARGLVDWQEAHDGLDGAFRLRSGPVADDALAAIREGVVDSFSVGFRGLRAERDGDTVVRTEAALLEVSLVTSPAYSEALVGGVRTADDLLDALKSLSDEERARILNTIGPASGTADDDPADRHDVMSHTTAQMRLQLLKGKIL